MKKSSKLFSFLAVVLCAFLLFGSVGSFQKIENTAEAASGTYEKPVSLSALQELKITSSSNYYMEYGEYPQSELSSAASSKVKELINAQFYNSKFSSLYNVSDITEKRLEEPDGLFTYDSKTGYFKAEQNIYSDTTTNSAGGNGTLYLAQGEKIYEYISGVNASEKYPVYSYSGTNNNTANSTADTSKNTSIRSANVAVHLDDISADKYYGSGTSWTVCDCAYCNGACYYSMNIKTGTNGSVITNKMTTGDIPYPTAQSGKYVMGNPSGSWLRQKATDNYTSEFYVELDGYWHHSDMVTYQMTFNFYDGNLVYEDVDADGESWFWTMSGGGRAVVDNDCDDNLAKELFNKAKTKLSVSDNKQIYQLLVTKIEDKRASHKQFFTGKTIYDDDNYGYTVRAWAMASGDSCAYCVANHNHGNTTKDIAATSVDGKHVIDTSNGYTAGQQYYFKVEPIQWRIVANDNGKFTLQSNLILDSMYYNLYSSNGTNFMTSYLRNWLNNGSTGFQGAYFVLNEGVAEKNSAGQKEATTNNIGSYTEGTTYVSAGEGKINQHSYRYAVEKNNNAYIAQNVAASQSKIVSYSSNKPSFFNMAFSNENTSIMLTIGQDKYTGYKGFSGLYNIEPGTSSGPEEKEYSKNYVTIPYSAGAVTTGGSITTKFGRVDSSSYTDFAYATGLVAQHDSVVIDVESFDAGYNFNYGSGSNVLLWTEYGSNVNGTTYKNMAIVNNTDGTTTDKSGTPFNMVNQSAGVAPVIKIDINALANNSNVSFVSSKLGTTSITSTSSNDSIENGSVIKTINRNYKATNANTIKIQSYAVDRTAKEIDVELYLDSSQLSLDNISYIKFIIGSYKEGTFAGQNADISDSNNERSYFPNVDKVYNYYAVNIGDVSSSQNVYSFTLKNVDGLDNADNFRIYAYLVSETDEGTQEQMISSSGIKVARLQVLNGGSIIAGNKTFYEGEIVTISIPQANDGLIYPLYEDPEFATEMANVDLTTSQDGSAGTVRLHYDRVQGWVNTDTKNVVDEDDELTMYARTDVAEYFVRMTNVNDKVSDVMYVVAGGKTISPQASVEGPQVDNILMYGTGGYSVSFDIYIKNAYIKQFDTIDKFLANDRDVVAGGIGFISFKVATEEGGFNNGLSTYNSMDNTMTSDGDSYKFTYDSVELIVSGPYKTTFENTNGVTNEVYYRITVNGVQEKYGEEANPARKNPETNKNETITAYFAVDVACCTDSLNSYTMTTFANVQPDTYSMSIEQSDKVKFSQATSSTGDIVNEITPSNESMTINGITYNSELNADIQFNTGYSLNTNAFKGENKIVMPTMTFEYATQVLDANGYRLSQDKYYPTTTKGGTKDYGIYAGSNIRLDPYGNTLSFDENSNLEFTRRVSSIEDSRNVSGVSTTNIGGAYFWVDRTGGNYTLTAPILKLHVNEYDDISGIDGEIVLIPKLVNLSDPINEHYYLTDTLFDKMDQLGSDYTIQYIQADLSKTSYESGGEINNDYEYLVTLLTVTDSNAASLLGTGATKETYYQKYYGYSSVETYIMSFVNESSNVKDKDIEFRIHFNPESITNGDKLSVGNNKAIGQKDLFNVYRKSSAQTQDSYIQLTISRTTSLINRQTVSKSGYGGYYLTAHYADFSYTAEASSYRGLLSNVSKYEYNYEGVTNDGDKLFLDPTPYAGTANANYMPWVVYTSATLANETNSSSKNINYDSYTLSSGVSDERWGGQYRQFFAINKTTGGIQIIPASSFINTYPTLTLNNTIYGVAEDEQGIYQLYEWNGNKNEPNTSKPVTNSNYVISYSQPITATLYQVKTDNGIKGYKAGDTFIRLTVNNVVSDIKFTLKEDSISEYKYPVKFYSPFGTDGTDYAVDELLFESTVTGGSTIVGMGEGGSLTDELESMVTTISGDVLKFKPYVINNGNSKKYYFMAPLANVAQSEDSNDLGIRLVGTTYYVGDYQLNHVGGQQYTANGDYYYFADKIYKFEGWKFKTTETSNVSNQNNIANDCEAYTKLWEDGNPKLVDNNELAKTVFMFTNTNCEVHLVAQYKELDLNIEFYSWNMVEGEDSGLYNVIEEYYNSLGEDKTNFDSNGFKYESGVYSLKDVKPLGKFNYDATDTGNNTSRAIENTIANHTFAGHMADDFGTPKGWYRKLTDAEQYVEGSQILGANLEEFASMTAIRQALSTLGYTQVYIWNSQVFYANANRSIYFSITQNGPDYVVECYLIFDFVNNEFTDNTQLYEIYETANKTVTVHGLSDTYDSLLSTDTTPSTVRVGTEFNAVMRLDDAYSTVLQGTQENPLENITSFVNGLTISTTTKYKVTEDSYLINFIGGALTKDSWTIDEATGNYIYYFANSYVADGSEEQPIKIGYVMVDKFYREITISISGVIDDVNISSTHVFEKNKYTVTLYNPAYDQDGQAVVNGEGQAISYGTFIILDENGNAVVDAVSFESGTSKDFVVNGATCSIEYSNDGKQAFITIPYGTNLYFDFVRNDAFSQYIDADSSNKRPFTVNYYTEDENGDDVLTTEAFTPYAFESAGTDVQFRYSEDTAETPNEALSKYMMVEITRDYEIKWTAITINTYALSTNSANADYYTAYLADASVNEGVIEEVALADGKAMYNQDVDVVFEMKPAYTQTQYNSLNKFIPMLQLRSGVDLVLFAHIYGLGAGSSTPVYINAGGVNVQLSRVAANASTGRPELYQYSYTYNQSTSIYRVYFNAETEGSYKGYYRVTKVADDTVAYNTELELHTLGYIAYDELNYTYYFKNLNTVDTIYADLVNYYWSGTATETWSASNKNKYDILIDESVSSNAAYTFTAYTVSGDSFASASINKNSNETLISDADTETDGIQINGVQHGSKLRFRITMSDAYTHTIPLLNFMIDERLSNIDNSTLQEQIDELFKFSVKSLYTTTNGYNYRTNTFSVGNIEFTVTQIFKLDTTFANWSAFVEQAGLTKIEEGFNVRENLTYLSATYVIDMVLTDSFTLSNEYNDPDTTDADETSYAVNTYFMIFNKYVASDTNQKDHGPLTFVAATPGEGQTLKEGYEAGKTYYYYQEITHGATAYNPFTTSGLRAPDGVTSIGADTFRNAEIDGYTYASTEGNNNPFTTTNGSSFVFSNGITGHNILYAPFTEETYNVQIVLPEENTSAGLNVAYKKYAEVQYKPAKGTYGSNLTSTNSIVTGTTLKYTATTFSVKYIMYSAYDHSSMRFSISQYGELKFSGDSGVTGGSFTNEVDGTNKNLNFVIDNSVAGKTVYSYYYNITTLIAKVTIDTTTNATGNNKNYASSTTYELEILKAIDAGNDVSLQNPGSIVISTRFVANTNENLTDSATGLNKYSINLFKASFTEHSTYPLVNGFEDKVNYGAQTYKTYDGWESDKYPTEDADEVVYVIHGQKYTHAYAHDIVTGYNFTGWCSSTSNTATVQASGSEIATVYNDYYLYAKYTVTTGHTITPTLDQSYTSELFSSMSANPQTASYGQEVIVTFVLGAPYTDNSNYRFSTTNSVIKSIDYNKGVYTVVLCYVSGTVNVGIATGQTVLENKYNVALYDINYTSTYTSEWVESITTSMNKVWNTSTNVPDTSDINETTNILTNIMHGKKLTETGYTGIDLSTNNVTGLVNKESWLYVIYDENFVFETDLPALIKLILDGADPTEDYVYVKDEINQYNVGIFNKNTEIVGDMYVFPYYTRQMINITLTEAIEGSVTNSSVIESDRASYTYMIPYGYPIISNALNSYDTDTYLEILNTDSIAKSYTQANANVSYIFDDYYLTNITDGNQRTLATTIAYTDATIYLNFIRKTYTVTLHKSWDDETVLGTMQIKYGDGFTDETILDTGYYQGLTVGDLKASEVSAGNGQYLNGWSLSRGNEESTPSRILSDCSFYPNILYNQYEFSVVEGEGFKQYNFQDGDILVDGLIPSYSNGFFSFSHDDVLTIKFTHDTGWYATPYLTYTLMRNGEAIGSYNNTEWLGSVGTVLNGSLYTITINGLNHRVLQNGDQVVITVNQSISSYSLDLDSSSLEDIVVEKSGIFVYEFDENVLGYTYEGTPVLWFLYDEFVDFGDTFTFTVRIAQKYARSSKFAFTLSAGNSEESYTLADATRVGGTTYDEFTFTLGNITENIIITVDTANSEIVASQFKVTYNYVFGGGVNGWATNVKPSSYAVVENRTEGLTAVEGQVIYAPSAVETTYSANYSLHGPNWYVLKSGGHNGINLDTITRFNIDDYFEIFDVYNYDFVENINVYSFYLVGYFEVTPEAVNSEKGNLELPQIQDNSGAIKYHADKKTDDIAFASGYTFSYTLDAKYSQNTPVISIVKGSTGYDLIIIDTDRLSTVTSVKKNDSVTYTITKTTDGYTYAVTSALSAGETSNYAVVISDGTYTIRQDGIVVATATVDESLKHTITLSTVNDTFTIAVNDEIFELNAYSIEFTHGNGNVEKVSVNYGGKLTTIPTDEKNFIQKLVYVVTYEDGTTKKLSSKELANLEITEDLKIEIQVEINLVILIPIVVGAVVVVVAIVVVIVKASQNRSDRRSSGKSNMEAFDKLNQNRPNADASKKSDKPYNPYIDNSKK